MTVLLVPTAYGRPASEALRDSVARAKRVDALAPVTIVVPTNSVGVATRRRLASGELGAISANGAGVIAVSLLTVYRLAELLAAPVLAAAGRRPVSTPVVASAVRRALGASPGSFAPVAEHPATEEALVAAHRELSDLDDAQLTVLAAQHPRASEVVRLHRATRALLASDWYDEHDLMRVATEAVAGGHPYLAQLGAVVCYLPQRWSAPAARLVRALADHTSVHIVAGFTGSARADAAVVASLGRVGCKVDDATLAGIATPAASSVVTTSDPDDEVRAVVREVVDAMRAGVPLERMAILYGGAEPYARLVHEHLDLAQIPHNGAAVRTLVDSVLGGALVRLLALGDSDFARDDVTALCAAAPVLDGHGRRVPATAWERTSRRAGVVRGRDEWEVRLDAYAARLGDDDWSERERGRAIGLRDFVAAIAGELDAAAATRTWSGLARVAHRLIRRFLGDDARRGSWSPFEQEAARRVEAAVDRLGALDSVDRTPSLEVFRRTLGLELDAARDRVGRLGEGLLAGPVGFALGVELDRLWVCGLAEGVFPSVPHDDPLLADRERAALDGELRLRAERVDDDHRAFLAALASTTGTRVCSYPRGDLRRSTEHVPSRFLAPTLATLDPGSVHTIASHAQGIVRAAFPASEHELAVQGAVARAEWVRASPPVARGVELVQSRASDAFTRFDGNLASVASKLAGVSPAASQRAVSPTRLEEWASCPHAYFVHSVLHVQPVERPEEIVQLSPIDRGSIVHEVLDRFLDEARARADAGRPWTRRDRERMAELAHDVCTAAEARGITGRPLLWRRDQRLILAELDAFLDADERYRAEYDARTLATELAFGLPGTDLTTVAVTLDDGRPLRVRGKADRIDATADGRLVVIDYKTGSESTYTGLGPDDPVQSGTRLQLPVYAYAARAAFGTVDTPVEACYWFVGRGNNRRIGYEVDAGVDAVFASTVSTIVAGIEGGVFVAVPPPPGPRPFRVCEFCDPDGLGTADRWREWERKCAAPELTIYHALGDDGEEDDS